MNVLNSVEELLQELARLKLCQFLILENMVKQLTSCHMLSHEEQEVLVFKYLIQLSDVRMPDFPQYLQLQVKPFPISICLNRRLINDLDGHFLIGQHMPGNLNLIEGALTNRFSQDIILNGVILMQLLKSRSQVLWRGLVVL